MVILYGLPELTNPGGYLAVGLSIFSYLGLCGICPSFVHFLSLVLTALEWELITWFNILQCKFFHVTITCTKELGFWFCFFFICKQFLHLPKYQPGVSWAARLRFLQSDPMSPCGLGFLYSWEISVVWTLQSHRPGFGCWWGICG